jgi:hypothetical protein
MGKSECVFNMYRWTRATDRNFHIECCSNVSTFFPIIHGDVCGGVKQSRMMKYGVRMRDYTAADAGQPIAEAEK